MFEITENISRQNSLSQFHGSSGINEKLSLEPASEIFGIAQNGRQAE